MDPQYPRFRMPFGPAPVGDDVFWRVEAKRYSVVVDADAEIYSVSDPELQLLWYPVLSRTPKGAWIRDDASNRKFVLLNAHKRYACPTIGEALDSFIARRKRQLLILTKQVRYAQQELDLAESLVTTADMLTRDFCREL